MANLIEKAVFPVVFYFVNCIVKILQEMPREKLSAPAGPIQC